MGIDCVWRNMKLVASLKSRVSFAVYCLTVALTTVQGSAYIPRDSTDQDMGVSWRIIFGVRLLTSI